MAKELAGALDNPAEERDYESLLGAQYRPSETQMETDTSISIHLSILFY